jgi:rubrerythrin
MNLMKKILVSLLMTTALVSTSVSANADGNAKVRAAGETTIAKVEEAIALAEKGEKAEVLKALGDVRQAQKEFRYEQTERLRQKAGDKLKTAKDEVENGDANAINSLKATLAFYKEMMVIYSAAH